MSEINYPEEDIETKTDDAQDELNEAEELEENLD